MYSLKRGVTIFISPEIERMLETFSFVFAAFKLPLVITSGLDGPHRENSLHYRFRAFDVRKIFNDPFHDETWKIHRENILDALENQFQHRKLPVLIVEEADHIHTEWCAE